MSYEGVNFFDLGVAFNETVGMTTRSHNISRKRTNDVWGDTEEFDAGKHNANYLRALFASLTPTRPARVYIPEGRYYIGLPDVPEGDSEQVADLLVPPHVTLVFGPKATIVPLAYTREQITARGPDGRPLRDAAWLAARDRALPVPERYRVRIEVQGDIEAALDKIFDPFREDDRATDGRPSTDMPSRRGGTVFFTRDGVRAVYPEWWGAVPKRGDDGVVTPADIRRTTVAIQSCIDAVLHHRIQVDRRVVEREAKKRPSTEVVFANDYVIDRPIRVGMTLAQARVDTDPRVIPNKLDYRFHPIGLSIRGECGPATRHNGAALLQAADPFGEEDLPPANERDPNPVLYGDSRSMMILRTFGPVTIDNVVFDANESAERCVTVMTFSSTHHHVLEGCTFKNAKYAQLYVGGEVPDEVIVNPDGDQLIHVRARYYSGGQDLGDMRVSRCHFETGTGPGLQLPRAPFRKKGQLPGRWRHGVVYRAEPALGTEFQDCVFTGPGSPMFLAIGGRVSFQSCTFATELLAENPLPATTARAIEAPFRWWNGTDIHLAAGFGEYLWRNGVAPVAGPDGRVPFQPVAGTMMTVRDVFSQSRQFLSSHPDIGGVSTGNAPTFASVLLINLRHRSAFPDASGERPVIYWGAPRRANCALILQSCVFEAPFAVGAPGSVIETSPRGRVFVSSLEVLREPAPVVILASRRVGGDLLLCGTSASVPNVARIAG